ncbi:MAG: DUF481 domain-containing protein [Mariprofundaceae bacterium]
MMRTMFRIFALSSLILLAPQLCAAVTNVDQAVIGSQPEGVQHRAVIAIDAARGNTVKSSIKSELLSQWKHDQHTEFLLFKYLYGTSRNKVDRHSGFIHLRHRTQLDPLWAIEAFGQVGRNPFARLSSRSLLGGGVRLSILEVAKKSAIYLGLGGFYEKESLNKTSGTTDSQSRMWRGNSYLVLRHRFSEQLRLNSTTYYQPSITASNDFRLLEQLSIDVQVMQHAALKISLDYSYDSKPPQSVKPADLSYQTGLEITF